MWKCIRCLAELSKLSADPSIDSFGIYFLCPYCRRRNPLVNVGKRDRVSLQQRSSIADSFTRPVLRLDGDLFFRHEIRNKTYQIQVTRECLDRVFGSDGSMEGDSNAVQVNLNYILSVASKKANSGYDSPIKVMRVDFKFP